MERALSQGASSVFRSSPRDATLVAAALAHGGLLGAAAARLDGGLAALAAAPVLGLLVCWGANTISHVNLHAPIFRSRAASRGFSLYLTLLLGIPQSWWKRRHLAHHAGRAPAPGLRRAEAAEVALVAAFWALLLAAAPRFFLATYLPGYLLGMLFCSMQGRFEHLAQGGERAEGVSHYGALYNALWFNDGHHVEHHRWPALHWTVLPSRRARDGACSPLPPLLRWAEPALAAANRAQGAALGLLERVVLGSAWLQRFVVERHVEAFRALLPAGGARRVLIVGGGLFPRTVLVLRRVLPEARIEVIDASADSIARARRYLAAHGGEQGVSFRLGAFDGDEGEADLLVAPLAFVGQREALYLRRERAMVLVHDWVWSPGGDAGAVISWALLKRLNLILPRGA